MISKIFAWIMAVLAALFSGNSLHTQEPQVYQGVPGYEINADSIDYYDLYNKSAGNSDKESDVCKVESPDYSSRQVTAASGVGYIVADAPANPNAKLEFSVDSLILAPGACKIESEPSIATDQIVVEGTRTGTDHWKMVIERPYKWFCCEHAKADVSGHFKHSSQSHKIELRQGQLVAVADENTKIKLFREDESGTLKECDYKTFLQATDTEVNQHRGQSNLNLSGDERKKTGLSGILSKLNIPSRNFYKGTGVWHGQGDTWWYGETNYTKAGVDYAASQWLTSKSKTGIEHLYYFDDRGYMVTGKRTIDGKDYYFTLITEATDDAPVGSVRVNKLAHTDADTALWINEEGNKAQRDQVIKDGSDTYSLQSDGTYRKSGQ